MTPEQLEKIRKYLMTCGEFDMLAAPSAMDLLAELDRVTSERDESLAEYANVCKFATDYEQQRDELKAALLFYSTPRNMGCTPSSGDHDDTTWCTSECGDYGKRARVALGIVVVPAIKKIVEKLKW